MSDLISRWAAIDALCKEGCGSGYCGISCDDLKAIEALPSAQPEQRWIPCSERLPEETKCYLVCCAHGSAISVDFYSTTNGKWAMCGEHVAAWQPLPELYKADMNNL